MTHIDLRVDDAVCDLETLAETLGALQNLAFSGKFEAATLGIVETMLGKGLKDLRGIIEDLRRAQKDEPEPETKTEQDGEGEQIGPDAVDEMLQNKDFEGSVAAVLFEGLDPIAVLDKAVDDTWKDSANQAKLAAAMKEAPEPTPESASPEA